MRVLHFLWSGEIGGTQRSLYQLVREQLKERENQVGVLFVEPDGPYFELFRSAGCLVESVVAAGGADLRLPAKIALRARRYDLHHFHSAEPLLMLGSLAAGRKTRVFTERGGAQSFTSARKRLRYGLTSPLLRRFFHGYSGNTRHAAAVAAERYRLPRANVAVTYNGLDLELLATRQNRRDIRAGLGATERTFVVGTSAYLKEWKRVDRLFTACIGLDGDYRVLVVGDGPDRLRLERVAERLGITGLVTFTGMRERVADYLQAMDAFVLPSNAVESFGNSVIEAMALGIPSAVFADSPGVCEHIVSGETGFIASDTEALTRILRELAAAPELRREVGERGAAFVHSTYTPGRMAAAYSRLYERAAARADGRLMEAD
jgi:glycosyltransferase involved in cell wall biosynthesis